jgi:hypothetical protein
VRQRLQQDGRSSLKGSFLMYDWLQLLAAPKQDNEKKLLHAVQSDVLRTCSWI